jgi:CRP/FNR family transcriptional regulator, cyclic AMP receptor protein
MAAPARDSTHHKSWRGHYPTPLNIKQPEGGGMQNLISLFSELSEEDAQWIFSTASEHQFFEKAVVIEAGSESTAIYFVLEGLLGVFDPNFTGNRLAIVGPGEFVGEMSFVEKQAADQTVAAVESSVILVLPRAELEAKLLSDKGFASRFNLGLAKLLSRRLRRTTARLKAQSLADNAVESGPWKPLQTELTQFKALMKQADDAALSNDGIVPSDLAGVRVSVPRPR